MAYYGSDSFVRGPIAAGFGTGSDGQSWVIVVGSTANESTSGTQGLVNTSSQHLRYGSKQVASIDLRARFSLGVASASAQLYARYVEETNFLRCYVNDTTINLTIRRNSVDQLITVNTTITVGSLFWLRFMVLDKTLYGKWWADGQGEPSNWTIQQTILDTPYASYYGVGFSPLTAANSSIDSFSAENIAPDTRWHRSRYVLRGIAGSIFTPFQAIPAWVDRALGANFVRQTSPTNIPRYVIRAFGSTLINYGLNISTRFRLGLLKDISTRFVLGTSGTQSIRDVATRFRLLQQSARDVAARFRLRSADQLKDVATRFRLAKLKDMASRFRLGLLKDVATRFRLMQQSARDVATRFRLAKLQDITTRFRLGLLKDVATRFRLIQQSVRDVTTRFRLAKLNDIATRFRLAKLNDIKTRFRLKSADQLKDIATRFRLGSLKDITTRFRLAKLNDIATRFRLASANQSIRDIASRFRLMSANQFKDVATRFRLALFKDVATRFRLMSASQLRDVVARFRLSQQRLKDVASRFRLKSADQLKDVQARFRLMSASQLKDVKTRFRVMSANQLKDIAARFILAGVGALRTKDIACRFVLFAPSDVVWVTRDGKATWVTRDDLGNWNARDESASWDSRDDQATWDSRDDQATWKTRR